MCKWVGYPIGCQDCQDQRNYCCIFVQMRQKDASFGAEQFQTLLTLARACAMSFGEAELSPGCWSHLKALEAKRQERLRVV